MLSAAEKVAGYINGAMTGETGKILSFTGQRKSKSSHDAHA